MLYYDDTLNLAHMLAKKMHHGQTYRSDHPDSYYNKHIIPVATMVMNYAPVTHAETSPVRIAAVLHDIVEDTALTIRDIDVIFNIEVADLVWAVTNEKDKNYKDYPKIQGNKEATLIKLCDRYINTQGIKKQKYRKEYSHFREKLYIPGMWDELWDILNIVTYERVDDDQLPFCP